MDQRLSLVTLGVTDLDRARTFYRALGWTPGPSPEHIAFFQAGAMVIGLWERAALASPTPTGTCGRSPTTRTGR